MLPPRAGFARLVHRARPAEDHAEAALHELDDALSGWLALPTSWPPGTSSRELTIAEDGLQVIGGRTSDERSKTTLSTAGTLQVVEYIGHAGHPVPLIHAATIIESVALFLSMAQRVAELFGGQTELSWTLLDTAGAVCRYGSVEGKWLTEPMADLAAPAGQAAIPVPLRIERLAATRFQTAVAEWARITTRAARELLYPFTGPTPFPDGPRGRLKPSAADIQTVLEGLAQRIAPRS